MTAERKGMEGTPLPAPKEGGNEADLIRRVQRTGATSLTVTLPRWWTESMGIHPGDALRIRDAGSGRLELAPEAIAVPSGSAAQKTLSVDARDAPPHLLPRLIIGAYITGHEQVVLMGHISPAQRTEVTSTVARLLGASIVEDTPERIEIQNFVDPTHYGLSRLVSRLVGLLRLQVEACTAALGDHGDLEIERLKSMEDEVDKIYRLMVRQLLLASDNFQIAKEIGVPSHHFQMGSRVVAKALEEIGDLLFDIGQELGERAVDGWEVPTETAAELARWLSRFAALLEGTTTAFSRASHTEANAALNEILGELPALAEVEKTLPRRVKDKPGALVAQRMLSGLHQAMRMLIVINEITINRAVEPEALPRLKDRVLHFPGKQAGRLTDGDPGTPSVPSQGRSGPLSPAAPVSQAAPAAPVPRAPPPDP